jgi:hypothetical protein
METQNYGVMRHADYSGNQEITDCGKNQTKDAAKKTK